MTTIDIKVQFTEQRVEDLLLGHNGSVSSWLAQVTPHSMGWVYGIHVVFDREEDQEGTFNGRRGVSIDDIVRGLTVMAEKEPYQFAQFVADDDDDVTFDVAWQCIIFGKTVYG